MVQQQGSQSGFLDHVAISFRKERVMTNLTRASRELFRRTPDETFPSLETLVGYCRQQREASMDHWISPTGLWTKPVGSGQPALGGRRGRIFSA